MAGAVLGIFSRTLLTVLRRWLAARNLSFVTRNPAWGRPIRRDQQGTSPLIDGGFDFKTSPHRRESFSKTEQPEPFGIGLLFGQRFRVESAAIVRDRQVQFVGRCDRQ